MSDTTQVDLETLLDIGELVRCAACAELSAFSWEHVNAQSDYRLDAKPGEIAHVGASSSQEWECGHCGAHNVEIDSPFLAEAYTHIDPATFEAGREAWA